MIIKSYERLRVPGGFQLTLSPHLEGVYFTDHLSHFETLQACFPMSLLLHMPLFLSLSSIRARICIILVPVSCLSSFLSVFVFFFSFLSFFTVLLLCLCLLKFQKHASFYGSFFAPLLQFLFHSLNKFL